MKEKRLKALRKSLRERNLEGLLVKAEANIYYLSGFSGQNSLLLVTLDGLFLITDFRYVEEASKEAPEAQVVRRLGPLSVAAAQKVSKLKLKKVAFEADFFTYSDFQALTARDKKRFVPVIGLVEKLRERKDAQEIKIIKRSLTIAQSAFTRLKQIIEPGATEKEIADELEMLLRREGASASSFPIIVAAGKRASLPHARPGEHRIGEKDAVLIDWGAKFNFYNSDLTRIVFMGRISKKMRRVYETVLEAQHRAIQAIKPGVEIKEVDRAAREHICSCGLGQRFGHGLGHGLGLEIHEAPAVSPKAKGRLKAGMVFSVEPAVYIPNWGGVRIEDMVRVTRSGCEVLSNLPQGLGDI
jgi:Xaa-Pro aminopeptidase